jgi:hypothetical protein
VNPSVSSWNRLSVGYFPALGQTYLGGIGLPLRHAGGHCKQNSYSPTAVRKGLISAHSGTHWGHCVVRRREMEFAGLYHNSSRSRVATHILELIGDTVCFEDVKWNCRPVPELLEKLGCCNFAKICPPWRSTSSCKVF